MSTEQSVDPGLVEQTRQQIRALVAEIAQLAGSDVAPGEFYAEFLNRVVQALAAVGGAVWAPGDEGRLQLQYQINLQKTGLATADQALQVRHGKLLYQVMQTGQSLLVAPSSGSGDEEEAGNPTEFLLVLAALRSDKDVRGVVEVFQRPDTLPQTQRGYLRFLEQMCEHAGNFLKTRALRSFTDRQALWTQLEQFTRAVHASLEPIQTAYTVANEGRRLIECDRVSVAIQRGKHCRIEAVSGQDIFDRRSNVVTLLGKLATAVVATGDNMWYTGDTTDMAPQVEEAVQAYVDESHSKTVAVMPLKRPKIGEDGHAAEGETVGALIVEQIEDSRLRQGMLERVEVVREHSSAALANALEYHSLFLLPVWQALGKASWVVRGRTLPKTIAICSAVLAGLLALVLVPADFKLEGKGTLEPIIRRNVFANEDGTVHEVHVKHDQAVQADEVLAIMRNTDLEVQKQQVTGELATAQSNRSSAARARLETRDKDEKEQLETKIKSLDAEVASLTRQLALIEAKEKMLLVKSPITGKVVSSWDVLEKLDQRPVKRGDSLMLVADPDQKWELEVYVPEDRMGHIGEAQRVLQPELPVQYILASDPSNTREGKIREVHASAEVHGEEGNAVRIRVDVNKEDLPGLLRPGATVTARVYCGRRSIGYVWFHDLIDFFHTLFFRFL